MFIFSQSKWLVFISPEAPPHPPCGLSPARACCWQLPAQPWGVPGVYMGTDRCHGIGVGAVPVGRYPWVGNHDGFQVEAPVAQIPAKMGRRAMAQGNSSTPSTCPLVSQTAAQGRCQESKLLCWDPGAASTAGAPWHGRGGEAAMLGARRGAQTSTGWLRAAPSQWLVLDVAASISNRISSQQLHFKAFHSAALME